MQKIKKVIGKKNDVNIFKNSTVTFLRKIPIWDVSSVGEVKKVSKNYSVEIYQIFLASSF